MEPIRDPVRARRLARAIASDLLLYNAERVRAGIESDDLFERMKAEFAEARTYFAERVDAELLRKENFVDRALVDVLVRGCGDVRSPIW